LKASEIIEPLAKFGRWGYSITNLLPAIHKTAYKFSLDFRRNFKLNYSQINFLLSNIPEEFRHRYTKENAKQLLELFAKEVKERIDK
jgi:4-hydroxy 2-oxovalerate aldolase